DLLAGGWLSRASAGLDAGGGALDAGRALAARVTGAVDVATSGVVAVSAFARTSTTAEAAGAATASASGGVEAGAGALERMPKAPRPVEAAARSNASIVRSLGRSEGVDGVAVSPTARAGELLFSKAAAS